VLEVKAISTGTFPGTNVVINAGGTDNIENPALPGTALGTLTQANFAGGILNESYRWVFTDKIGTSGTWVVTSDYEPASTIPNQPFSITQEFTVEDGYSVLQDQVISVDPVTGNAIPGYTFPGSTSVPNALADLGRYILLDPTNNIIVGVTNNYSVLVQLNDDGVTRPTFGAPLLFSTINAEDRAVDIVRMSDSSYAILFENDNGNDFRVVAFKTNPGTITHPPNAESLPLGITLSGTTNNTKSLALGGDLGTGELIVAFTDTDSPNNARDLVLQRFVANTVPSPPTLTNFPPQVVYTSPVGSIQRAQSKYQSPSRVLLTVRNGDGTVNDIIYVERNVSAFTLLDSDPISFTLPPELGEVRETTSDTAIIIGITSGRYKTYSTAGDVLTLVVNQDPVFILPGSDSVTGGTSISNLPGTNNFIATSRINSNTGGIVYGLLNAGTIAWGTPIYNQLPSAGSPVYISTNLASASVQYQNTNGTDINGLASISVTPGTSSVSLFRFEGPYPIAISTQAGNAGDTIIATVYGLHDTAVALTPGEMYFADTDGSLVLIPQSDNVQYKSAAKIGAALTANRLQLLLPAVQSVDFS